MSIVKSSLLASTMLCAVFVASSVAAQTANTTQNPPSTPTPPSKPASNEVVVTGSRLHHTTFNTPAPVQVITNHDARLEGLIDSISVLQGSTAAAGYTQINNQFGGYVVNGGPGISSLSLRGLGGQRTLVLLNGRRLNPAGVSGTVADVDLNVIPDALVERYEVLKDGASSIYGSDAIGGVVNIITRNKFDGLNIETNDSIPQEGAGKQFEVAVSGGRVRDNYHVLFGLQYFQENAIRIRDLPGGACPLELQRLPTGGPYNFGRSYADGSPYCANTQTNNVSDFSTGGVWVYDPSQGAQFPYSPFSQSHFGTVPRLTNIATDPRTADVDAASPSRRAAFTLIGAADLPHNVEFYFEDLLTNRRSQQAAFLPQLFPATDNDIVAVSQNPFNPFTSAENGPDFVQPILTMPVTQQTQDVWAGRALFGLRGDFGSFLKGWKWDTSLTYGLSRAHYTTDTVLAHRFENALNVVVAPSGTDPALVRFNPVDGLSYTCAVNVSNPAEKCYPLNFFESSAQLTRDPALAYMRTVDKGHTSYDQVVFDATADGPIFNLPAGPVQGVIGIEYRYDSLDDYPGKYAVAHDYFNLSSAGVTRGDNGVVELYLEGEAPLLKGKPLVDSLTLNVSTRYTNYRSGGSDLTYKLNLNWQIIPSLRARATYGTSFRGPALYENYLAAQTSFTGALDPCAQYGVNAAPTSNLYKNCASEGLPGNFLGYSSTPEVFTQGAQGRLKSETSKNLTVGPVWQPSFADLQVSVSYFHIEVDNEITTLGPDNILNLCYDSSQFRNGSPYCTLISPRDSNNNIALIDDSYLNVAQQLVSGIDADLVYRKKFDIGEFTLDLKTTYAIEDKQELFPGSPVTNYTGTFGEPRWNGNLQLLFRHKDWTFDWSMRYLGEQNEYPITGETPGGRYLEFQKDQLYHSLGVEYQGDKWRATFVIRNLFNDYPPVISNNPDAAFASRVGEFANGYGNLNLYGRSFYFSLSKDF
ncbi:TonB-dependent receptor domain-containing protein [Phenylobacterium montanum]|uniref:TonB-dependent receptor n=1 Tax=Phenylobacterium montanum TaxID=2823693 RepID=A0A975G2H1_9CAUL|nr:TonB-dependent receptor [Caulobacter sp. S6]QUD89923.1 TonB-dependent receptor [Caulobacter sp. S6]